MIGTIMQAIGLDREAVAERLADDVMQQCERVRIESAGVAFANPGETFEDLSRQMYEHMVNVTRTAYSAILTTMTLALNAAAERPE